MSKKWLNIFCCLLLILTLTACNTQAASSEENNTSESSLFASSEWKDLDNSESLSPNSSSISSNSKEQTNSLDMASVIPEMTAENQAYYDKYLKKLLRACPFTENFTGSDFSKTNSFSPGLIYQSLTEDVRKMDVPEKEVEATVQQYFDISVEDMRRLAGPSYGENTHSYIIWTADAFRREPSIRGVITRGEQDGDILVLTCDWYLAQDNDNSVSNMMKELTSVVSIKIKSDDAWTYYSSEVIDIHDPMHYAYDQFHSSPSSDE